MKSKICPVVLSLEENLSLNCHAEAQYECRLLTQGDLSKAEVVAD
jgi:hypothetical protein